MEINKRGLPAFILFPSFLQSGLKHRFALSRQLGIGSFASQAKEQDDLNVDFSLMAPFFLIFWTSKKNKNTCK
jgi:hypothetical protein